jgi:lysozyme
LKAYPDPLTGGLPITIGWGSTRDYNGKPFTLDQQISQSVADNLLINQIKKEFIPELVKIPYWGEMNMNQRGALLSFAYNLGANFYGSSGFTTIARMLKERRWNEVPKVLEMYRNPGSKVEAGLLRRRKAEGKLWVS